MTYTVEKKNSNNTLNTEWVASTYYVPANDWDTSNGTYQYSFYEEPTDPSEILLEACRKAKVLADEDMMEFIQRIEAALVL